MRTVSTWVKQPWKIQPLSNLDWQTLHQILCDRSRAVYQLMNDLRTLKNLPLPRNYWPGKIAELNNAVKLANKNLKQGNCSYRIASTTRGGGWQVFMLPRKYRGRCPVLDCPEQILSVFFAAMQDGYAKSGVKKGTIAELPGSKTIPFKLGDFKLLDCYLVTPNSPHSFGQTIIWYHGVPVWMMSYQGWYDDGAIPFLKRALREAYDRGDFFGGRGPHFFQDEGMTYTNRIEFPNDWRHFRGREEVFDRNGQNVGWHEYQGLLLIK